MNKKQAKILTKIILRATLLLLIIGGIITYLYVSIILPKQNQEFFSNPTNKEKVNRILNKDNSLNAIECNGVSFRIPNNWTARKSTKQEGMIYQISAKNSQTKYYEGVFINILNMKAEYIEFYGLKESYSKDKALQEVRFYNVTDEDFNGIKVKSLKYEYKENGTRMKGAILQFNHLNKFFMIDKKGVNLSSIDFSIIEQSFKVK
jgi:hypothetical protein